MVAIFVALMFVGFVLMDLVVERNRARRAAIVQSHVASAKAPITEPEVSMGLPWTLPQGVYVSESHAWFKPDPSGVVRVGADALLVHAMGKVNSVTLPKLGGPVMAGQPMFQVEREGCVLTVPSLVTAKVVAVNERLRQEPQLVAAEPYGTGWVCAVIPTQLDDGSGRLRVGEKAAFWLECEFERFRDFVCSRIAPDLVLGATSLDGGLPALGALTQLENSVWGEFQREFLLPRSNSTT